MQRYYVCFLKCYVICFEVAVKIVDREYGFIVRQNRVENYLNTLKITNIMNKNTDGANALLDVYKAIVIISRNFHTLHGGDAHCIVFLRRSTICRE